MILRRVHIRRFRKLTDQQLECGPGLNVIQGRNDAGKSTLHLAFSAVFFPVRPSDVKTYGPWGEVEPGEITVEFEAGARTYRLRKDFGARRVVLESEGGTTQDPRQIEAQIGDLLGLTSAGLFRATAHIRQWDLDRLKEERQEIGTRLARIVTGGDADAARVLNVLDEQIRRLEIGLQRPAKTPGPLKRDQDGLVALTSDHERLVREVEAIERAAVDRDRLVQQITVLERQVQDDDALVAANRRLLEFDAQWKLAAARAEELDSLLERIDRAAAGVEAADADDALRTPAVDPEAVIALREAEARARMFEAPAGAEGPTDGVRAGETLRSDSAADRSLPSAGLFVLTVLAAVAGLGGAWLFAAGEPAWGAGALIFAAALAGGAWAVRRVRDQRLAEEAAARAEALALARHAAARRAEALAAAADLRRRLEALGVPSVRAAEDLVRRADHARLRQAAARTMLSTLLGGRTRDDVAGEHRRVLLDLGIVRAQREDPDLALRRLDPQKFQRLQAEAAARKTSLRDVVEALHRLEGRLGSRSPHEDRARAEEQIEETRGRLSRHQRFADVLKLTRAILFEAHRSTIVPGRALLEDRAGRYLRELSGGAYERVAVDEHTLAPRVWVGPPKGWTDVASREIGSGAVDQCYLALRLALVDVLCADRRPPLFLDDPFLAYDEQRERAAMDFLRDFARNRQVFLLTCRSGCETYADQLIVLGEVPSPAGPAPVRAQ